jgi:hypothetical protein
VSTLPALVTRPTSPLDEVPADTELSLTALLDLFALDEPGAAPVRRSLRSHAARLGSWVREQSRRAAAWGAVPERPVARGTRSSAPVAKGGVQ